MSPFLHVRSWLRSGPSGERGLVAVAVLLLLPLVLWASTPWGGSTGSVVLTESPAAALPGGEAPAPVVVPTSGTTGGAVGPQVVAPAPGSAGAPAPVRPVPGATVPSTSGGSASTATSACGPLTATDQGVTATTITVGIIVVDIGALGAVADVPSAADQRKAYEAAINDLNKHGGIRCRRVVGKYYNANPLDTTAEHAACLQAQQDKVFVAFNNMYNQTEQSCLSKAKIPNIWYTPPHTPDVRKYAPYILSWQPDYDQLIHQYIHASKSLGFFNGMKKLGILEESCYPDENTAVVKELRSVGIDPSKASVFNYGCTGSTATGNPQADQQAALQFKREGVTHVVNVAYTYDSTMSKAADQQAYHPKFTHMEDSSANGIETASQKPGSSFDGTLLITTGETGASNTAGYRYNQATQDCTKVLKAVGLPAPYTRAGTVEYAIGCIDLKMLKAAAENAPSLTRAQLSTGLARAGALELSFPAGPLHVTNPSVPTSGQSWRPAKWFSSCDCWRVTDVRYRSTF